MNGMLLPQAKRNSSKKSEAVTNSNSSAGALVSTGTSYKESEKCSHSRNGNGTFTSNCNESSPANSPSANNIVPKNTLDTDNINYIRSVKDSSIEMLIKASEKYKSGLISKEQYITVALQVSQMADYYNKTSAPSIAPTANVAATQTPTPAPTQATTVPPAATPTTTDSSSNYKPLPAKNTLPPDAANPVFLYGDSYNTKTGALISHGGGICTPYSLEQHPNCSGGCGPCPATEKFQAMPSTWVFTGAGQDGGCEAGYTVFWTTTGAQTAFTCNHQ